jgi:mono/diheme cytochrome c family protein
MKQKRMLASALTAAALAVAGFTFHHLNAAEPGEDAIKQVMKIYHKAPKGVDPICKKASDGKATPAELKNLVAAYRTMSKASPPKGDAASWKEKTAKLLAAAEALSAGQPDGAALYKEAVNCKACHSVHKPD